MRGASWQTVQAIDPGASAQMVVESGRRGDTATLTVHGSVDKLTRGILRKHVGFALQPTVAHLVLDMRRATVGSGGIDILAEVRETVRDHAVTFTLDHAHRDVLEALAGGEQSAQAAV